MEEISESTKARMSKMIAKDPVLFAKTVLAFEPFDYQEGFLRDRSKFIIVSADRQTGKTTVAAVKAICFALANKGSQILVVSATHRLSALMSDKIMRLVAERVLQRECVLHHSRTRIRFDNGSEIYALPCGSNGFKLTGHTADMVIVDDAANVSDEVITDFFMPMVAATNGTTILISGPSDRDHYFYKAFCSSNWSRHRFTSGQNPPITKEM